MKKVLIILFLALMFAVRPVFANEGRIDMSGDGIACEGVSVWDGDWYRIFGRCQGLPYPYAEQYELYSLWVDPEGDGDPIRIGEVDRGMFDARTDERFTSVFVTAEQDFSPRVPSDIEVVSGDVAGFDFRVPDRPVPVQEPVEPGVTVTPMPDPDGGFLGGRNAPPLNIILLGFLAAVVLGIILFIRR